MDNRIMDKLDSIDDKLSGIVERVAVNENDIDTLKGSKSWIVNLASAVGAGGAVAWFSRG